MKKMILFTTVLVTLLVTFFACKRNFDNPVDPGTPLQPPQLLTPADGNLASNKKPSFSWQKVNGAEIYELAIANNNTFQNPVIHEKSLTGTIYTAKVDLTDGSYWWRVKIKNRSDWSKYRKFTVGPLVDMLLVQGGTFTMGDTWGDGYSDEKPTHQVTLSSFYISKYEITQAQYLAVMGTNPSSFSGDNKPVERVSWYDAVTFCNKLSQQEGLTPAYTINGTNVNWDTTANGYRLPTEAEWEYAARGGSQSQGYKYSGSDNPDDVAWYSNNSGSQTHDVGTKQTNELGIYDMSGNVWEGCWDWYNASYYSISPGNNPKGPASGTRRVLRGGSWLNLTDLVRSAVRGRDGPDSRGYNGGFRCVQGAF